MARLQFRSATQQKGFAPIQLSRASLSEMEKRDAKLLDALEKKHAAEIKQREINLKGMEDNAEYTEKRFKENREIELDNLEREQASLNQIADRDRRQADYDQSLSNTVVEQLLNVSSTVKKVADQRTAKQLEDQTALAMAQDLDPYEALLYEGNFNTAKRGSIQASSLIQQEGAQSGEPPYKTFQALAAEKGLGLVGQRVLLNRLYGSAYGNFLNKNLQNTEQQYQLPNGKNFSGAEAYNSPDMLKIVQSRTRSQVDDLMRTKHGVTEALFFSPARGDIEEQNKVRITQAEGRSIELSRQIGNDKAEELLQAGEYDTFYHTKMWATSPAITNKRVKDALAATDDIDVHEGLGNITYIDPNTGKPTTFRESHKNAYEAAVAKGNKSGLKKFEAEQEYRKNKRKQDEAANLPSITKAIEIGGEPSIEDYIKTSAQFGISESEFHPVIKLAISSYRKNSKQAELDDLNRAIADLSLTAQKANSYENPEVRTQALAKFNEQEEKFFGVDHKATKATILKDAKDRTNVTDGGDANSRTRKFYNAYIKEIIKFRKKNPGASYDEAEEEVNKLVTQGELGIYDPVNNPEGAPLTNPFARGEDAQNNYIYPNLNGMDTDRLTFNDNLLITKGDAIADIPYALGNTDQMARAREDVALGKIPTYPPLMVRALEKLNANPRYQNNPLKMSEFFQRQQDAINKVTGKDFQLLPATPEQDWTLSLPAPLYKKVTSGNFFQYQHVEAVVRGTVNQKLRTSMGGNSGTFNDIVNTARASGAKFPELVAAQWALESDSGKAPSGINNFFGMKATSNETSTSRMTTEYRDGTLNTEAANFKDYASKEDSVNDLVNRWYKNYENYQGVNNANSIEEAAQMLQQQGYATDPNYANKLIQILNNNIGKQ
jgi:flagellum-specific peptidoglycan hydrolase FlgJ